MLIENYFQKQKNQLPKTKPALKKQFTRNVSTVSANIYTKQLQKKKIKETEAVGIFFPSKTLQVH
jgi:hypothetical protein